MSARTRPTPLALLLSAALALGGCGAGTDTATKNAPLVASASAPLGDAAALGKLIFEDPALSASGALSCASCHDPARGHASPFAAAVALGGPAQDQPGTRVPPSIRYLRYNTSFSIAADGTPSGGFTWDGRASSLSDQARRPFLSANEMANASPGAVVARIAASVYAGEFRRVFGADIFNDPEAAFDRVTFAVERYQLEDPDFAPFTSKFDYFVAGKVGLTPAEMRGYALFNRPDKGNCAACHPSSKPDNAPGALFTDFTYDALGVPRNPDIPANADPTYFDQGLCGPARTDLASQSTLCGAFKVPSLRNVGVRRRFFHNGRFGTLEEAVAFYVRRDTHAAEWYPLDGFGNPDAYNDLPAALRGNVNTTEAPYNRLAGQPPALDTAEIADLVAFLRTLTDGYTP
ncbi:MAG: cytochrome c peroxidase [Burkholderiales bacterium]